jgi:aminoglycoside phosphotransferase (APT) family kinase protein
LNQWLPGLTVEKDHSWGLAQTTVLEVTHAGARFIVKAGGVDDHRIAAATVQRLRNAISAWPTPAVPVVPTHGDWQPRNWLTHEDIVSIIDFGRAAMRPAYTDFARLAAQEFRIDPILEMAFMTGYGDDPRETSGWHRSRVRKAIGTACWAYAAGIESFEAQGHRMIAEALSAFPA